MNHLPQAPALALLAPDETLTAVMSGAAATTDPTYSVIRDDGHDVGSLDGATDVTLVSAPGSGLRHVERVSVYNGDTAAVTVTINKVVGGTDYPLLSMTVPVGAVLIADSSGVRIVDSSGQALTAAAGDSGTVGTAAANVVAAETGGLVRKTILTLTDVEVTVGNTAGVSFGGTKIYDFPAGRILVLGVIMRGITFDLTDAGNVTPIDAADGGDVAIGSTVPSDGTLTGTDVDLMPSTSIDPISAGITGAALAASAQFDGTTTPLDANLNILIDDADVGDGASDVLLVSGVVELHWVPLGDY